MKWISSELFLLALRDCNHCGGRGCGGRKAGMPVRAGAPCEVSFAFVTARFRDCVARGKCRTQVSSIATRAAARRAAPGAARKKSTWPISSWSAGAASTRSTTRSFGIYFLLGADWQLCCKRLGIDRGIFFHAVYRIEERLGKAFYETEPYALYPPNDYFVARRLDPGGRNRALAAQTPRTGFRRRRLRDERVLLGVDRSGQAITGLFGSVGSDPGAGRLVARTCSLTRGRSCEALRALFLGEPPDCAWRRRTFMLKEEQPRVAVSGGAQANRCPQVTFYNRSKET